MENKIIFIIAVLVAFMGAAFVIDQRQRVFPSYELESYHKYKYYIYIRMIDQEIFEITLYSSVKYSSVEDLLNGRKKEQMTVDTSYGRKYVEFICEGKTIRIRKEGIEVIKLEVCKLD